MCAKIQSTCSVLKYREQNQQDSLSECIEIRPLLAYTLFISIDLHRPDALITCLLNLGFFFWVTAFTEWCNLHHSRTLNGIVTVLCLSSRLTAKFYASVSPDLLQRCTCMELALRTGCVWRENSNIQIPCWWRMVLLWKLRHYRTYWEGDGCYFADSVPHTGWQNHKWNATWRGPQCIPVVPFPGFVIICSLKPNYQAWCACKNLISSTFFFGISVACLTLFLC